MTPPAAGLSLLQRAILDRLAAQGEACISVKQLRGREPKSNADSAAFSRSLARLANRGLVVLLNARVAGPGERATHILLTAADQAAQPTDEPAASACVSADPPSVAVPAPSAQMSHQPPPAGRCCRCARAQRSPADVLCSGCRQWLREAYPHLAVN